MVGLLIVAIGENSVDGVRVLLKYGADRECGTWGDCVPRSPMEAAKDNPKILALLNSNQTPSYVRKSDPPLPALESAEDQKTNRQGEILDATGLAFQADAISPE